MTEAQGGRSPARQHRIGRGSIAAERARFQRAPDREREVLFGCGAIGELDIQAAALFTKWKITSAVQGKRKHAFVVFEDAGCPVALVDIEIDDCEAGESDTLASPFN